MTDIRGGGDMMRRKKRGSRWPRLTRLRGRRVRMSSNTQGKRQRIEKCRVRVMAPKLIARACATRILTSLLRSSSFTSSGFRHVSPDRPASRHNSGSSAPRLPPAITPPSPQPQSTPTHQMVPPPDDPPPSPPASSPRLHTNHYCFNNSRT